MQDTSLKVLEYVHIIVLEPVLVKGSHQDCVLAQVRTGRIGKFLQILQIAGLTGRNGRNDPVILSMVYII